jgi:phosphoglycolate phosphatase-like HAD superfamily hydrolase
MSGPQQTLRDFPRRNDAFVGIDSDGCVFDTMEVKHKECFIPNIVREYRLAAVSKYVREAAEFLNLYSKWRGINRFPGLVRTFDLLAERPEVARRGIPIPRAPGLREWVTRETKLANPALRAEVERTGDPDLAQALAWSEAVNASIAETVRDVPPFPFVREVLEMLASRADVMVVSATPTEALVREWREHDIAPYVGLIAGQELGSKAEHLAHAAPPEHYPRDRVLLVGDAPGDLSAARANDALFYPIDPGDEDASWRRLHDEALPRFFAGTYAGAYMDALVERFLARLPETPPWA